MKNMVENVVLVFLLVAGGTAVAAEGQEERRSALVDGVAIDPGSVEIRRLPRGTEADFQVLAASAADPRVAYIFNLGDQNEVQNFTRIHKNRFNRTVRMESFAADGRAIATTWLFYNPDGSLAQQVRCDGDHVVVARSDKPSADEGF